MLAGELQKLHHTPRRFVRQADGAHFARLHQFAQSGELYMDAVDWRLVLLRLKIQTAKHRRVAIGPVDVIQIEVIGL